MRLTNIIERLAAAAVAFACLAGPAPGCGPSTAVPPMDGGFPDDAAPPNNEGDQIFPADTEQVVATSKGGFVPPAPDGSTCQRVDTTYTLHSPSRTLTWSICDATDDAG